MGASVDSGACDTTQLHSSVAQWPIRICDECDLIMRGVPYKHHPHAQTDANPVKESIDVKSPQTTQFLIRMYLAFIDCANLLDL